jgi:hypothetical protein
MRPSIPPDDGFLYDAILSSIEPTPGLLIFSAAEAIHTVVPSNTSHWQLGSVGRLRLESREHGFAFHVYADQRLRRAPDLDDIQEQKWGWRIGERRFQVQAGILPGRDGAVVRRDTEFLEIELPREFLEFCAVRGLTPMSVLRAFVGDLRQLFNWVACPREDGYSTNGSDERMYAMAYFQRTFGWVDDPEYRAQLRARRVTSQGKR